MTAQGVKCPHATTEELVAVVSRGTTSLQRKTRAKVLCDYGLFLETVQD
jgi:hypothetical protein